MLFLSVIIALALVQYWGSGAPLHKDRWFYYLVEKLRQFPLLADVAGGVLFGAVAIPLVALGVVLALVDNWLFVGAELLVLVPVLLYSFGRENFSAHVDDYLIAWSHRDSARACQVLAELQDDESELARIDNWLELHSHALRVFAYCGFERLFAVLFWFLLLGPGGALLYRTSRLYFQQLDCDSQDRELTQRWLWVLEWPAVRVLGFSWALAGNFVGCFQSWSECLLCRRRSSAEVLYHYLKGALGEEPQAQLAGVPEAESAAEVEALQSLLSRTLVVWLALTAIFTLLA